VGVWLRRGRRLLPGFVRWRFVRRAGLRPLVGVRLNSRLLRASPVKAPFEIMK
jgi:hypothetical protein